MNLLLSSEVLSVSEILSWGSKGLVIGLSSVFLILVILIGVINIMRVSLKKNSKVDNKKVVKVETPKPVVEQKDDDEDEIIAVIAAAINCMAQREGKRFAIKSFTRIKTKSRNSY
jgi:sodium pump decarboxylase gamma subunit